MANEVILERYLTTLLDGDRKSCRTVIEETLHTGMPANSTRINRTIVDQLQNKLPRRAKKHKKIVVCCSQAELQELGAQILADLFESDGWEVKFLGGGLTNDDILAYVHENGPDILLIYGTTPKQAPGVRRLIDAIRDVNAWQNMRIMVSGGLFNRAEGLWEEIGADLFAATAVEALQKASQDVQFEPAQRTIKRKKKRRRKKGGDAQVSIV